MSKLTEIQRRDFDHAISIYNDDWKGQAFFIYDKKQKTCVLGVFSDPSRRHVQITTAYCVDNDIFKKKIGFTICVGRILDGRYVTVPVTDYTEYGVADIEGAVRRFAVSMHKNDDPCWRTL